MICLKNKYKNKYKRNIFKIYYKINKMKLEEFKGKPKRKYVRKPKEVETNTLNIILLNNENNQNNQINNSNSLNIDKIDDNDMIDDNIMNDLDNEINENLVKSIKRMKLNHDDSQMYNSNFIQNPIKEENVDNIQNQVELLSTINRIKPTKFEKVEKVYYNPNVMHVKDYEFMNPINVYLYYVSEKIGKNVTKFITYTHIYKHIDHHILCPTIIPPNYNASESSIKKEETIMLAHNVKLYIREYTQSKRNYSYENCQKSLLTCKKRKKIVIETGFDYDFCQLHIEGLDYKHKNSYIFEHEHKYFMFEYDIYNKGEDIKLLTNGE